MAEVATAPPHRPSWRASHQVFKQMILNGIKRDELKETCDTPGWSATFDTSGLSLGARQADHMSPDRYELSALFGSGRHRPGGVLMLSIYSLTRKPSGLGFRLCRTDHLHEPYRQTPSELRLCAQPGLHVEPGAAPQLQRPTAAHLRLRGRLPGLQRISFLSA